MMADSLATAVSVLGPEAGSRLVRKTSGAGLHLVRQPADEIQSLSTREFDRYLEPGQE
jgi:thiamine biosynthesis lipoprotein ApbE